MKERIQRLKGRLYIWWQKFEFASLLEGITDMFIYILFLTSIGLQILLLTYGTYYLYINPGWDSFYYYAAALLVLAVHLIIRFVPTIGGGGRHKRGTQR